MVLRCVIGFVCFCVLVFASYPLRKYLDSSRSQGEVAALRLESVIQNEDPAQELDGPTGLAGAVAGESGDAPSTWSTITTPEIPAAPRAPIVRQYLARVVDEESGEPIAGVVITREHELLMQSDEAGRFLVEWNGETPFALGLEGSEHGRAYVFVDEPLAEGEAEHLVRLRRSAVLRASVLDRDGRPYPGLAVVVHTPAAALEQTAFELARNRIHPPNSRWEAVTDAEGRIVITGLPAQAPLELSIWEVGRGEEHGGTAIVQVPGVVPRRGLPEGCYLKAPRPVVLAPGEERASEWRLEERLGLQAKAADSTTTSRPYGGALPDATPVGGDSSLQPVSYREPGPELDGLLRSFHTSRSLAGRIVDGADRPALGLVLLARSLESGATATTTCRADGSFSIGPLEGEQHELVAYGGGDYGTQSFGPFARGRSDLVLRLAAGRRITGSVRGSEGRTSLALYAASEQASRVATTQSEAGGAFHFDVPQAGTYRVLATSADGRIALSPALVLEPGQRSEPLELVLEPGGTLAFSTTAGASARRAIVLRGQAAIGAVDLARGGEERLLVPAGTLAVRIYEGATLLSEREVVVGAGAEVCLRCD